MSKEQLHLLEEMAEGLKDDLWYNAPGGLIQGTNLDAYRVANDSLRLIAELKQTREENQRLRDQVDDLEDYVSTLEEDIRNLDSGD